MFEDGLQISIEILENQQVAVDSGNQPVPNWQPIATELGRIDAMSGIERAGLAESSKMTHHAMLSAAAAVTAANRLRGPDGRVYGVVAVNPIAGAGGAIHHLTLDLKSIQ